MQQQLGQQQQQEQQQFADALEGHST